jgi:hypothetical protein
MLNKIRGIHVETPIKGKNEMIYPIKISMENSKEWVLACSSEEEAKEWSAKVSEVQKYLTICH